MRIHLLSDLHLEFADFDMPEVQADVRVIAGDLHLVDRGLAKLKNWSTTMPTIYILGNHEFYGAAIPKLYGQVRTGVEGFPVHLLEQEQYSFKGVRFLGCTLWTDFALFGPQSREVAMLEAAQSMRDYRKIRVDPSYRRFSPAESLRRHLDSVRWLDAQLKIPFDGKTVVVTHHAPSAISVAGDQNLIAAAYATHLEELIAANPIDIWMHGHTHQSMDYQIGSTRIISNQRGYPGEQDTGFDPTRVVTV